jgi:hypothetical protein
MNLISKTVPFIAFLCLLGCSAARPKPEVQPAAPAATPAEPRLYIRVINLPGWAQSPDSEAGGFLLLNQAVNAQVQISTFTKEQGEPRDIVGWLMVKLASQGAVIGEMTGEPGAKTARLTFSASIGGRNIGGLASAKWSRIDGIGFLVVGLWPADNEPSPLTEYEQMFQSVDLYEQ